MENKCKERYEMPWIEVIDLEEDIIRTSGGDELPDDILSQGGNNPLNN